MAAAFASTDLHTARGGRADAHRITLSYTDRTTNADDSGDFKVELKEAHTGGNVTTATLLWASIPSTVQNINDSNNQITATDAGGTATVTLTNGTYDATSLATHIAAVLTANGTLSGTYTGSFDAITNKITIAIDSGTWSIDQSGTSNPLRYVAGLTNVGSLTSTLTDLEFPNVVGIVWPYVVLEIPELAVNFPLEWNVSMGSYSLTTNPYPDRFKTIIGRRTYAHQLSVKIKNPFGRIVNLQGGMVALELELE